MTAHTITPYANYDAADGAIRIAVACYSHLITIRTLANKKTCIACIASIER